MNPKLRFKGFDDAWEQRKCGDVMKESRIPGHSGDVAKKITVKLWGKGVFKKDDIGSSNTQYFVRKEGQFIYSKLDFLNSAFGVIPKELDSYETTADLPAFDCVCVNPYFMFYRAIQPNFYYENGIIADGSRKAKRIHADVFLNMPLKLPSIEEQNKITKFLLQLENLITLHQRQCEVLKKQKQFFLQNMFPKEGESEPRIRFNGFTEPWEQRKLGELAPLRGGFAFKSEKFTTAGIPIVKISNILQDGSVGSDFSRYEMIPDDENFTLRNGDTVLAMSGATTGKVSVLTCTEDEKYYQNQRVGFFTRKGNFNYDFVSVIVRSHLFIEQLKSVLVAGAQPNVSPKDIDSFEFMVPQKFVEQEKIGHFFKSLDKLITLHQRQYEQLVSLKKYLLSKMFI